MSTTTWEHIAREFLRRNSFPIGHPARMSYYDLADKTKINVQTLNSIFIRGTVPSLTTAEAIAKALGFTWKVTLP